MGMLASQHMLFTFGLRASLRMLFNRALLVYDAEIYKKQLLWEWLLRGGWCSLSECLLLCECCSIKRYLCMWSR